MGDGSYLKLSSFSYKMAHWKSLASYRREMTSLVKTPNDSKTKTIEYVVDEQKNRQKEEECLLLWLTEDHFHHFPNEEIKLYQLGEYLSSRKGRTHVTKISSERTQLHGAIDWSSGIAV